MSGTKYVVDIEFRQSGDPSALVRNLTKETERLDKAFLSAASGAVGAFTGIVEKVGAVAFSLAGLGVSTGIAAVTYGVMGLNTELETTKVSLGAVLNANDRAAGIQDGVEKAAGWIAQMKKDARDLPGEFEDLLGIVQSAAGTAFNAGMDVPKFEKVASSVMAAAKALNVQTDQAGRELAQLFEGRAGAHNVLGMRLKIDAHKTYEDVDKAKKKFNELSAEGRVKVIEDAVGKFGPAIEAFGKTYDAQSSTLVDNVKSLIQVGTKDLFDRVVADLADINNWFDKNRDMTQDFAKRAGDWLVHVHDKARRIAEEWIPILKDFGERAYSKFVDMWDDAAPIIEGIAKSIKDFLGDKDSVDRMADLLKLYIAAKATTGMIGIVKPDSDAVGAAVGGAVTAPAGAVGGGAAASMGIMPYILAIGGAIGGVALAAWQASRLKDDALGRRADEWNNDVNMARVLADRQGGDISIDNEDTRGALKDAYDSGNTLKGAMTNVVVGLTNMDTYVHGNVVTALVGLATSAGDASKALMEAAIDAQNMDTAVKAAGADLHKDIMDYSQGTGILIGQQAMAKLDTDKALADKKREKEKSGGGNTTVNINFTISSNQAPDQIARKVVQKLVDKRRFRVTSSGVPNWGVLPASGT